MTSFLSFLRGSELFWCDMNLFDYLIKPMDPFSEKKMSEIKYIQLERKPIRLKNSYQNTEKQIFVIVTHIPLY